MKDNWITIDSSFFKSPLWLKSRVFSDAEAFIDLVAMAGGDNRLCDTTRRSSACCGKGQVATTMRKLALRWGWCMRRTQRFIKYLVDTKSACIDSTHERSIITIENYIDKGCMSTQASTPNMLSDNDLQPNGIRRRVRRDTQASTQADTPNMLDDNNLQPNGIRERVRQTSTIDSIVYSNEYISIKDKSLIDAPYAREDEKSMNVEENTSHAGTTQSTRPLSAADYEAIAEHYNEAAARSCLPPLRALTPKRKAMLRARCREYGAETLITAIDKAAASPFLNGDNRRGWRANFDWIFRPNNFIKIIENNYDEKFQKTRADIYRRPSREEEKLRRDQEFAQHLYNKLNNPEPEPELADI